MTDKNTNLENTTAELHFGPLATPTDINLKADAHTEFPFIATLISFLIGLLFLFAPAIVYMQSGFNLGLLPMGFIGLAFCSVGLYLCSLIFQPLYKEQAEVMRDFPFNKAGEDYLRGVVAKGGTVRGFHLRKAVKLHRKHESWIKNAQVDQLRKEVQQRFHCSSGLKSKMR